MAGARLRRSLAASTKLIPEDREMHSQLSYTAAKLEIADHQRRAERGLSRGRKAKPTCDRRPSPIARLVTLRRTRPAPSAEMAPAGHDAA
jgi:hypothetical protein